MKRERKKCPNCACIYIWDEESPIGYLFEASAFGNVTHSKMQEIVKKHIKCMNEENKKVARMWRE